MIDNCTRYIAIKEISITGLFNPDDDPVTIDVMDTELIPDEHTSCIFAEVEGESYLLLRAI